MARHESGSGREGGSGSDRSDRVRRGTSVVTSSALPRALCPVCRPMMPERGHCALSGSPSPGCMPSTCGPNPEVPWRRRQH
eukprot:4525071-Prymnesium_polylepis.1